MAKKSKTQRAKASARRAEKKAQASVEEVVEEVAVEEESKKGKLFSRKEKEPETTAPAKTAGKKVEKKADKPDGAFARFGNFIKEVRSELRRVTWPSRQDVIRWSGVVIVALVFFGVYVFVLDNAIGTPILYAISGLGA